MDEQIIQDILTEVFSSFEPLDAQTSALLQFLKAKGLATDEELAPFLAQARNASNVRWLAARIRLASLLSSALKPAEKPEEKPQQKSSEKTSAGKSEDKSQSEEKSQQKSQDKSQASREQKPAEQPAAPAAKTSEPPLAEKLSQQLRKRKSNPSP